MLIKHIFLTDGVMVTNVDKMFSAEATSIWQFLVQSGQGCFIPPHQRQYAWTRQDITRLFEDVVRGIQQIVHRSDTMNFVGTIIAIHDTNVGSGHPSPPGVPPSKVMTIIDGQQRICTILMFNIALHDLIRRKMVQFKSREEPHLRSIVDISDRLLADLKKTYSIDTQYGDGLHRYYPEVIRAYSDRWSDNEQEVKYESPIAKLIWEYLLFSEVGDITQFRFDSAGENGSWRESHRTLSDSFRIIQSQVDDLASLNGIAKELPNLGTVLKQSDLLNHIYGTSIDEEFKSYVGEKSEDPDFTDVICLLRLVVFARYLNHRVAVTIVTAKNENDAGDMFESLNTTGELLTAFETFTPRVIQGETLEKYEGSPSYRGIAEIESYLSRFGSGKRKEKATSEMLIAFALAETGYKLGNNLAEQRRYLRGEYNDPKISADLHSRRALVRAMASVSDFMNYAWNHEAGNHPKFWPLQVVDPRAQVGFDALKRLDHTITIAPLTRFYQRAVDSSGPLKQSLTQDFIEAIKATVAFSMLWRGAKGGTANIDNHYRTIMRAGVQFAGEFKPPLARRPPGKSSELSLENYRKALAITLKEKGNISNKDEWIAAISQVPVYKSSASLARFLLFCASDDTVVDADNVGLIKVGRLGINPMLTLDRWNDDAYLTVEHIAPQSKSEGWYEDIYSNPVLVNTLGNLTLLPQAENNLLDNKSWNHKRAVYRLLTTKTPEEFDLQAASLQKIGLTLSKNAVTVLNNARYLGLCESIAMVDDEWSVQMIEERTKCLAGLAWDRLALWLQL